MFSILILTKNEEVNLPECIESVSWCDDIVVLDSFSDDRTESIACELGARFYQRAFDDFGSQRNFALDSIVFKNRWVFHLDADERFNEPLRSECERVIAEDVRSAYLIPNRIIFLGKWIRHCTQYPYHQVRLLKVGEVSFRRAGHGQKEDRVERGVGTIDVAYDHFNFSKGIHDWIEKHNRYSDEEAGAACELIDRRVRWDVILKGSRIERNRELKVIQAKLPFRWVAKFLYLYLVKWGFRDGAPGFIYCVLQGFYDFMIVAKIRELEAGRNSVDPDSVDPELRQG